MTQVALKNIGISSLSNDEQMNNLDNSPVLFDDVPTVNIPKPKAEKPATVTPISAKAKEQPETLEALKEKASLAKLQVENALQEDSRLTFKKAMDEAQTTVQKYNARLLETLFNGFLQEKEPIHAFMKQGYYKKLAIATKEGKEGTGVTLDEKDAILPLAKFVTFANTNKVVRSADWQSKVQRVTALLSIRAGQDIGHDVSQMLIDYDMDEKARGMVKKDIQGRAKNPLSNNTLVSAMQDMLDDVLFTDNGKGKGENTFKVVTSALMYYLYILFNRGSKPGTIATPRPATVENYLVELAHLMVNGINFSVEYKKMQTIEKAVA